MQGTNNMAQDRFEKPNITAEALPHTGKLEGDLQELPLTEGTPSIQEFNDLDTGELGQVLPAPETSGALTLEDNERDDFQRKLAAQREYNEQRASKATESQSHTGRNIGIAATSLVLAAGAAAGVAIVNSQPQASPNTQPSATGAPVPGETQAPAVTKTPESPLASPTNLGPLETAKPTAETKTGNFSVEQLKAMSVDQYNKLPQSDRLPLVKHQLEEAQKVLLIDYGNDDLYKNDPLETASLSNTPDQIMKQIVFEMQLAGMQGKTNDIEDGTPDKIAAQKALSAAFYNVDSSKNNVALEYTVMSEMIKNSSSIFKVSQKFTNAHDLYPPKTVVDAEGKKIEIRTITTIADDGKPHTFEVTHTMLDKTQGIWQIYNSL